jgi:hypothetical protein
MSRWMYPAMAPASVGRRIMFLVASALLALATGVAPRSRR